MSPTKAKPKPTPRVEPPVPASNGLVGEVFTLGEAAAYLRLPAEEVLRAVREQHLPARQVGQEWRFLKSAIQDWLRTGSPPKSNQEVWRELAGKYRDDPDLVRICEEAYQRRGRPITEEG
jgi:excisionase family DNA binding protein